MAGTLHRCPQCKMVGKVNRSRPRSLGEKVRLRLIPIYGVYRCHNCNWRGWMVRSSASPLQMRLLVATYLIVIAGILGAIVLYAIAHWPTAHYRY